LQGFHRGRQFSPRLQDLIGELGVRQRPSAQEEEELEVALRLGVLVAIDDDDAAALAYGLAGIAEDGDKIVHELQWGQKDFLWHHPLIA
jgi:hypothetical protein